MTRIRPVACAIGLAVGLAAWLAAGEPARAAERVAVIFGNSSQAMPEVPPHPTAAGDAGQVAGRLRALGFNVTYGINMSRAAMDYVLAAARGAVGPETRVVLLYFAGRSRAERTNLRLMAGQPPAEGKGGGLDAATLSLAGMLAGFQGDGRAVAALIDGGDGTEANAACPDSLPPGIVAVARRGGADGALAEALLTALAQPGISLKQTVETAAIRVRELSGGVAPCLYLDPRAPDSAMIPAIVSARRIDLGESDRQWAMRMAQMRADYARLNDLDATLVEPAWMEAKWREFLEVYAADNPQSGDDEALREAAGRRAVDWAARAARTDTLTREPPPPRPEPHGMEANKAEPAKSARREDQDNELAPPLRGVAVRAATGDSWLQVRRPDGRLVVSRLLRAGNLYSVPDEAGLLFSASNAGALELLLDGRPAGTLGGTGETLRDAALDDRIAAARR